MLLIRHRWCPMHSAACLEQDIGCDVQVRMLRYVVKLNIFNNLTVYL